MGVFKLERMVRNSPDFCLCYNEDQWCILPWGASDSKATACHAWDLWWVLYLHARRCFCSLSVRDKSINLLKRDTCIHFNRNFSTKQHRFEPGWVQTTGRNVATGLASLWRQWTEAALDRYLASFRTISSSMTELTSGANVSAREFVWRKTFWAFNLTAIMHVVLHILFVNFMNIQQVLLCQMQQNLANFGLSSFAG